MKGTPEATAVLSDELSLLRAAVPVGPRESELMRLPELAELLSAAVLDAGEMSQTLAEKHAVAGLLGDSKWAGKRPASLTVYLCHADGPRRLDAEPTVVETQRYPSARERALRWAGRGLTFGDRLEKIGADSQSDAPAPRHLAVFRADALQAFGLSPSQMPGGTFVEPAAAADLQQVNACKFTPEQRNKKNLQFCLWVAQEQKELKGKSPKPTQDLVKLTGLSDGYLRACGRVGRMLQSALPSEPAVADTAADPFGQTRRKKRSQR